MVHRALLGSLERFFGVLIEHYAGNFPMWLAPVQAHLVPVNPECDAYAKEVQETLKKSGFRVTGNYDHLPLKEKIKLAQQEKIPYMVIIGNNEVENSTVSLRLRGNKQVNAISLDECCEMMSKEVREKTV
jgi:threonyl-tRNA synthetase